MIIKEQVLKALELIEEYQQQERNKIEKLSIEEDTRSISVLGLDTREINCLKPAEIETIGELLAMDRFELRKLRNLGKKGIQKINKKIKDFGIETEEFKTY